MTLDLSWDNCGDVDESRAVRAPCVRLPGNAGKMQGVWEEADLSTRRTLTLFS